MRKIRVRTFGKTNISSNTLRKKKKPFSSVVLRVISNDTKLDPPSSPSFKRKEGNLEGNIWRIICDIVGKCFMNHGRDNVLFIFYPKSII